MGGPVLAVLDEHYLRSSRLGTARRELIAARSARGAAATAPGVDFALRTLAHGEYSPSVESVRSR